MSSYYIIRLRFDYNSTALRPFDDLLYDRAAVLRPKWTNRSAWLRLAGYVTVTLMIFDKQSNGRRIVVVTTALGKCRRSCYLAVLLTRVARDFLISFSSSCVFSDSLNFGWAQNRVKVGYFGTEHNDQISPLSKYDADVETTRFEKSIP